MAEQKQHPDRAHIFIVKLWQEVLDEEQNHRQIEWRGKIQDVFNGETHYFRDGPTILKFISDILPELGSRRRSRKRLERPTSARKNPVQVAQRRTGARE